MVTYHWLFLLTKFFYYYYSHNILLGMNMRFTGSYGRLSMKFCTYFDPQNCMLLLVITIVNWARNVKKIDLQSIFSSIGGWIQGAGQPWGEDRPWQQQAWQDTQVGKLGELRRRRSHKEESVYLKFLKYKQVLKVVPIDVNDNDDTLGVASDPLQVHLGHQLGGKVDAL